MYKSYFCLFVVFFNIADLPSPPPSGYIVNSDVTFWFRHLNSFHLSHWPQRAVLTSYFQTHIVSFSICVCKEDSRLTKRNSYFTQSSEDTRKFKFSICPIKISSLISTTTTTKQFKFPLLYGYIFQILRMSFKKNVG